MDIRQKALRRLFFQTYEQFNVYLYLLVRTRSVRDQQAHQLIKYSPHEDDVDTKLFRDVLEDANH